MIGLREPSSDIRRSAYYQSRLSIAEELVLLCRSAHLAGAEIEYVRARMGDPLRYIWQWEGYYIVNADLLSKESRLQEFIESCCEQHPRATERAEELHKLYCQWRGEADIDIETLSSAIGSRYEYEDGYYRGIGLLF